MSRHNGLPGFDAWLTRNPFEGPEPTKEDWEKAWKELGEGATDEEVEERAYQIMDAEIARIDREREEAEAESRRDDRESC